MRYKMPVIVWALVIFAASSVPGRDFPNLAILKYDKVLHIIFYCIFGATVFLALEPKVATGKMLWSRFVYTILIAAAYGASDEFHQLFVPGRSCDVYDFIADVTGGCCALVLAWMFMKYRAHKLAI